MMMMVMMMMKMMMMMMMRDTTYNERTITTQPFRHMQTLKDDTNDGGDGDALTPMCNETTCTGPQHHLHVENAKKYKPMC